MKNLQHVLMTRYDSSHREMLMMCYRDIVENRRRKAGVHRAEKLLLERGLVEIADGGVRITAAGIVLWEAYLAERDALNQWNQSNHKRRGQRRKSG